MRTRREKSRIVSTVQYCAIQYLLNTRYFFVRGGDCCWLPGNRFRLQKASIQLLKSNKQNWLTQHWQHAAIAGKMTACRTWKRLHVQKTTNLRQDTKRAENATAQQQDQCTERRTWSPSEHNQLHRAVGTKILMPKDSVLTKRHSIYRVGTYCLFGVD